MTIACTSATGKVGSAVLESARRRGVPVRALTRAASSPSAEAWAHFDFDDAGTYAAALRDVDALILIAPSSPQQADNEIAVAAAAQSAGVRHIVKLSVSGAETGAITLAAYHQRVEQVLAASGLATTLLRPTFFMQNALALTGEIRSGSLPLPIGEAAMGQIDTRDIADVALTVALAGAVHAGKAYTLTGPAAYTGNAIAQTLSETIGRDVRFVDVPEEAYRASLLAAGVEPTFAQAYVELYGIVRAGYTSALSGDVALVTGRAPRSWVDFARDAFAPATTVH